MRLTKALLGMAILMLSSPLPGLAAGRAVFATTKHDAGTVELGSAFDVNFVIRNEGDAPLTITAVRPQCGCTVADYTEVIQPGTEGKIHAHVDTKTLHAGKQAKTITVNTDAPGSERVVLSIEMDIITPLEFLPKGTIFLRTIPGKERVEKVLARPHRPGMRILSVTSSNPALKVSMEPAKGIPDKGISSALLPRDGDAWISVVLPADAPEGVHRADVVVATSDPAFPEVVLKVNAVVRPATS